MERVSLLFLFCVFINDLGEFLTNHIVLLRMSTHDAYNYISLMIVYVDDPSI